MNFRKLLFEGEILRLMSFTLITKPIALLTQMLIASYFGAGVQLDAYMFALFPVNFFTEMVKRVFSAVAIPQIIKIRDDLDRAEVAAYQNAIILFFYIPVFILFLSLLLWGNGFVDTVGYQLPQETKDLAYRFVRFLAIPALLLAVVGFSSAILNLNKFFRIPAMLLPLNAIITLISLFSLHDRLGIWALPASFAISQSLQMPVVLYRALKSRSLTFARPHIARPHVALLWSLSWMVLVTQALLMINGFMDKWFATGLESGSISSINYSMVLMNFGQQIFSLSLIVVMFTKMSEYFAAGDMGGCDSYIRGNLVRVTNLVVPVSLALFLISPEIVTILFERGAFDRADTLRTSGALGMYLLGLPALVINGVVTKIFQSLQRLREKIWLALQYILTNIIGNLILVKTMGIMGLAISSSLAINLHVLLSLVVLHRFRNGLGVARYMVIIARAYGMALFAWWVFDLCGVGHRAEVWFPDSSLIWTFLRALTKFAVIVAVYGLQVLIWFRYFRKPE